LKETFVLFSAYKEISINRISTLEFMLINEIYSSNQVPLPRQLKPHQCVTLDFKRLSERFN